MDGAFADIPGFQISLFAYLVGAARETCGKIR